MKRKSDAFDEPASPDSKPSKKRAIETETQTPNHFGRGLFDPSQLAIYKENYVNSIPYVPIELSFFGTASNLTLPGTNMV